MISIDHLDTTDSNILYEYLSRCATSLVYGTPRFLTLIASHLNANIHWLVATERGPIVGLLPYLVKDGPFGPVYNSLPYYGSNGGVIQDDNNLDAKRALISYFYENAAQKLACSATLINNPLLQDHLVYESCSSYTHRDIRIGQITHLPLNSAQPQEDLIKMFDDPRPRNIRKAIKENVVVTKTQDLDSLKFLFETHQNNISAIGGKPKRRSFFQMIPEVMTKSDWDVYIAHKEGRRIAALLVFYFSKTVEYFTPATLEEYRPTQALSLICFQAMIDAMKLGYSNWNWGGTWLSQGGVYDYKKRWGTTDYKYHYFTQLRTESITKLRKEEILECYPDFYVLPFSALKEQD